MKLEIYQVDAFSDKIFSGNPACVVPLKKWYPDDFLLNIAKENSVSETAFFINKGSFLNLDGLHLIMKLTYVDMQL